MRMQRPPPHHTLSLWRAGALGRMPVVARGARRSARRHLIALTAMVVAIDGPAGAGKSTVAPAVARAPGFPYLASGSMSRAGALQGSRSGNPPADEARAL